MNQKEAERLAAAVIDGLQGLIDGYELYLLLGAAFILFVLLLFGMRERRTKRRMENRLAQVKIAIKSIHPAQSVEHNLNAFLELIGGVVDASSYAFYTYDDRGKVYVLKAVRHRAEASARFAHPTAD